MTFRPPIDALLYDFKDKIPPWTSYCRSCIRRAGLDPYKVKQCPDAATCEHYPFKWKYKPPER